MRELTQNTKLSASLIAGTAFLILVVTAAPVAFAASAHFVGTPTVSKKISGTTATLTTSGKVAGLGSAPVNVFLTTSGVTAETACTNKGGNNPPGQEAHFGPTTGQVANITPRNGQITFHNAA